MTELMFQMVVPYSNVVSHRDDELFIMNTPLTVNSITRQPVVMYPMETRPS